MTLSELGIQKRLVTAFQKKKIFTTDDLMRVFPRHYHDYRKIVGVKEAEPGTHVAIKGILMNCEKREMKGSRGKNGRAREYMVMKLEQDGVIVSVICFQNMYLYQRYCDFIYSSVVVCGVLSYDPTYGEWGYSINSPEIIEKEMYFVPTIKTIYPQMKGISDANLRKQIDLVTADIEDPLPAPVLSVLNNNQEGYMNYGDAIRALHHPNTIAETEKARERIILNDMLYFAYCFKPEGEDSKYTMFGFPKVELTRKFLSGLPFELSKDQKTVVSHLLHEQAYFGKRMNCLVMGDVGSGKTVIAIAAMIQAHENAFQSVLMAPREVLARQHYLEIETYAKQYGIRTAFLRSGMKAAERKELLSGIKSGEISIIVGTQAVLSDSVEYHSLALVVTDEEHLFGVRQKEQLAEKSAAGVHRIAMSATPIPRTLASIFYGNGQEILEIKTMPQGRLPIQTATQRGRSHTFPFMEKEIRAGHQCYVVCPAIEDNEETEIMSVEAAEKLYRDYFEPKGIRCSVLNGRMSAQEISETIDAFLRNETQILISTTVIEVGVNVPNATVIVIESAERFGLASLHQLRGRVGRSSYQSYCILISPDSRNERLQTMVKTTDGFAIAEADLKYRGTGNLIGTRQSGVDKMVDEMLANRETFQKAQEIVRSFSRTGYLKRLVDIYEEHNSFLE